MKNRGVIDCKIFGIMGTIVLTVTFLLFYMMGCSNAEDLYEHATVLSAHGDYRGAIKKWEQLIGEHPDSLLTSDALFHIGKSHTILKNYKEGRKVLTEYLRLSHLVYSNEARLLIAQSYLDEEKYNQAYLSFDALTSTEFDGFPQLQAEAMYKAAYSLKKQSISYGGPTYEMHSETLSDEVLARYTEFLTRFPNSTYVSDAHFDQGKIYAAQKKYEFALNRYEDALRNTDNPKRRAEIRIAEGRIYFHQRIKASSETAKTVFEGEAIEAFEKAIKAASQAIEIAEAKEDIDDAKLDRVEAQYFIANIHIQRKEWQAVRDVYNGFIEEHGEAGYNITDSLNFKGPIKADFMAVCAYWIGRTYHETKDFGKALEWYEKIIKEKGFQTDDSVPDALKQKDLRSDMLAPEALYRALLVRNQLEGAEKLEGIANKYINDIRDDNPLLSAMARFSFAKIKREVLHDYEGAAEEFAKLEAYRGSDLRLNLIKLQSKYYEGRCSENSEDAEESYRQSIMLFNLNFHRLIDSSHIRSSNISEGMFDYCIQTALEYAEKTCAEIKDPEYAKNACAKIKEARQKLENKDKTEEQSDALNNSQSSAKSQANRQLTAQRIVQRALDATVLLSLEYADGEEPQPQGTGFFVRPDLIATNHHVIKGALRGTAQLVRKDKIYAIIGYTAIDPDRDLAILKVRAFDIKTLPLLSRGENIEISDDVYAVGNPLGKGYLEGTVSYGKISGIREDPTRKWIQITAPITPGNSGGPVLNKKGEVIGISTMIILDEEFMIEYKVKDSQGQEIGSVELPRRREQNLNFAVHVVEFRRLLEQVGPPKPLSDLEIVY